MTRAQAKELLRLPDRTTLKGRRDYVILSLLVGCALRRSELAALQIGDIQQREGRWVLVDLVGKGRRVRSVAVPGWVKQGIDEWVEAAKIAEGRRRLAIHKGGRVYGTGLGDWAVWSVVEQAASSSLRVPTISFNHLDSDSPPMHSFGSFAERDAVKDFGNDLCRFGDRHSGTVEEQIAVRKRDVTVSYRLKFPPPRVCSNTLCSRRLRSI